VYVTLQTFEDCTPIFARNLLGFLIQA